MNGIETVLTIGTAIAISTKMDIKETTKIPEHIQMIAETIIEMIGIIDQISGTIRTTETMIEKFQGAETAQ